MTASDRAAAGHEAQAAGAMRAEWLKVFGGREAWLDGVRLFASDVVGGVRSVSHNALAMVGLLAVVAALFLANRADVRYTLETEVLGWLMERANLRAHAVAQNEMLDPELEDRKMLQAVAEPEAILRATAANPAKLTRQQANVAYWIARRYNVAPEPISRLVQEAWDVGQRASLEPTLVLAVMAVESSFNPFAQSHVGAQGLMQVMTRIHQDKYEVFGGQNAAFDPVTNIRVGALVLKDCIRRAGSLEGGLKYYVGAANLGDDGGYAAKVLAEQGYLKQVASGAKLPTTVTMPQALVQADVPVAPVPTAPAAAASKGAVSVGGEPAHAAQPASAATPEQAPATTNRGEHVAMLSLPQLGR
jgi:soluble lytic murein transglycosylase-like protein